MKLDIETLRTYYPVARGLDAPPWLPGEPGYDQSVMDAWSNMQRTATKYIIDSLPALIVEVERYQWRPIETAPKGDDSPRIILGFAADEEGFEPESREGFFNHDWGVWVSCMDANYPHGPQPTHWMPRPPAPVSEGDA